ncbi:MAG: precorrin-6A synthase (deacetylating) [Rhodospirillales bacterium]|nr:MAG: precorrin-6A synthase (deacetylating) [Rhodospirillales bacterium]
MIELLLVGIGSGNPDHLTGEAVAALHSADVVLIPRKGTDKRALADLRRRLCAGILSNRQTKVVEFDLPRRDIDNPAYLDGVAHWHSAITDAWARLIGQHAPQGGRVALMVWGDPALYDSSLRIADRLRAHGIPLTCRVVPGISSLQMLAAAFAIPLNTVGAPFLVTTGRRLRTDGWPAGVDTVIVMLDGTCAFQSLDPEGITIYWAAYLGMPCEIRRSGLLAEVGVEIVAERETARRTHGWIMDTYLLRRATPAR